MSLQVVDKTTGELTPIAGRGSGNINDSGISNNTTWSSQKINSEIKGTVTSIDLSNIVTPSVLVEIVYAGIVLKSGMATLYLRVKALVDFTGDSGSNLVTGVPYIPIPFDHRNMEIIGRNLTQGNVGAMSWFRGDAGHEGDIDIANKTMVGVNHHKDDIISMSVTYIYREIS